MKLPALEPGHEALRLELSRWDGYVASALTGVESIRACARVEETYVQDARAWLESVALIPIDDAVLGLAASLAPAGLRTLDAIHVATAISVREEIGAFATYDERLAAAAVDHGFEILQPA